MKPRTVGIPNLLPPLTSGSVVLCLHQAVSGSALYKCLISLAHFLNLSSLRNSPDASHRADTSFRKFLRSLSLFSLSFQSLLLGSTKSPFVKIAAAL